MAGSSDKYRTLTSASPGPGSPAGVVTNSKSLRLTMPTGRELNLNWRFWSVLICSSGSHIGRRAAQGARRRLRSSREIPGDPGGMSRIPAASCYFHMVQGSRPVADLRQETRSEEHTSEL